MVNKLTREEIEQAHFDTICYLQEQANAINVLIRHSRELTDAFNDLLQERKGAYSLRDKLKHLEEMQGKLEYTYSTLREHIEASKRKAGFRYK